MAENGGGQFLGTFEHTVDSKHRIILPSAFRETLMKNTGRLEVYLTPGFDTCVFAFDIRRFQEFTESFETKAFTKHGTRDFERLFFSNTAHCRVDSMGRVRIPDYLLGRACIKKDVVVAGASRRFEIWDRERWVRKQEELWNKLDEIGEELD